MEYIVCKKLVGKFICGDVILPYGSKCCEHGGIIYHEDKPICYTTSDIAHKHFARNDDGYGGERGKLLQEIMRRLNGKVNQAAWNRVWGDLSIRKYKRKEHADYWLWNHDFFNAPIEDLEYILKVVKGEAKWTESSELTGQNLG